MHKNVVDRKKFVHKNVTYGEKGLQTVVGMEKQPTSQTTHSQRRTPGRQDLAAETLWRERVQECGIRELRQVDADENHIRRGV